MAWRIPNRANGRISRNRFPTGRDNRTTNGGFGGASFSVSFTGLSSDSIGSYGQVGGHASIGFTTNPSLTNDEVKWSASASTAAAATFGSGSAPTDFAVADGFLVYLHVRRGAEWVTRSFLARRAPGTAPNVADQSPWTAGTAIGAINAAASGAGLTFSYSLLGAPAGITINPSTGSVTGTPTGASSGVATVTAVDQYGRVYSDTFAWSAVLPAAGSFAALTGQSFMRSSGVRTYTFAAATGAGLTWTYGLVSAPSGVTIDGPTRTVSFDTGVLVVQTGTTYTVRATDQFGRSIDQTGSFTITALDPAVITILSAGPQSGDDLPISYTISKNDPTVEVVLFDPGEPAPAAADFGGGGAPVYIDQGTVNMVVSGAPFNLNLVGITAPGFFKLAFLPTGGGDSDVVVTDSVELTPADDEIEAGIGSIVINELAPLGDDLEAVAGQEAIVIQEAA